MAWTEEQDEPGWDCYYIIKNYEIIKNNQNASVTTITVAYDIIAMYCADNTLKLINKTEQVVFKLVKVKGEWKIKRFVPYPRILLQNNIPFLKKKLVEFQHEAPSSKKTIEFYTFIKQYDVNE